MNLSTRDFLALAQTCRLTAPETDWAARFLRRPRRNALHAVIAFSDLLWGMISGRSESSAPSGVEGSRTDSTGRRYSQTAGCGCDAASIDGRRVVAGNVIEYLFHEAAPGSIGRPDLEAFVRVVKERQLPRQPFDRLADGVLAECTVRRFATEAALERHLDRTCGPMAEIVSMLFVSPNFAQPPTAGVQALAHAIGRARLLLRLETDWVESGRCDVPLETLTHWGLRDVDLGAWADAARTDAAPDRAGRERDAMIHRMLAAECAACIAAFEAANGWLRDLPPDVGRATAMYAGQWVGALRLASRDRCEPRSNRQDAQARAAVPLAATWLRRARWRAWWHALDCRIDVEHRVSRVSGTASSHAPAGPGDSPRATLAGAEGARP